MENNIGKELFDMVYQRGRVGIVVDHTAHAFKKSLNDILESLIVEPADTPENWNEWSIERQLGYNRAILNFKQQLRDKWLNN